ncbi:methionine synthase [Candidatus Woesearchaeota archaeon]|nr:methionine synthase [Candidatus Woesearchaeota archaeon]
MVEMAELLKHRILLLDGAMGTSIHNFNLSADDFGGEKYAGCNEYLVITRPDIISDIHQGYLEAGSDIIETNTFAGSSITLAEFGLAESSYEINKMAAELARKCALKYSTPEKPRFVAGAIGPTNKTISVTGNISFDELEKSYYLQAKALMDGKVDFFLIETVFDTLNAKAALSAIQNLFEDAGKIIPITVSATIEQNGTMLAGQDIESFYTSVEHTNPLAVGINCALGPDLMKDHLRSLAGIAKTNVICYPNAGLPLEDGTFPMKPKEFADLMKGFIEHGWVNIIGGCCGTTKEHIVELSRLVKNSRRRMIPDISRTACSGTEALVVEDDNRPVVVGERMNVIGSRKFKELICDEQFDIAAEIGIAQVKGGAQVLDVCLANPDRDELKDTIRFYDIATKTSKAPLMIDSTDHKIIEAALKRTQGKCIINSINFEDGLERCEHVLPLVKKYGAAVIFGTIDEDKQQAMATTVEKKVSIAQRAYKYLTEEWGIAPEDIIFDTLVFPIATGDAKYSDSAKVTIEAIKEIKEKIPKTRTILGISNVSFGLPARGRETLNSVYLYHTTKAGLDFAIINSEKLIRYPSISEHEKKLAEDLLLNRTNEPITPFVEFYRGKKIQTQDVRKLHLNERLPKYIIEGRKDGLMKDLDEALKASKPLEIINGPLMAGMDAVGKLFNENKLIVSEVLQSAESMKAAVTHLEKFMEKSAGKKKGKVILATVKGDVHDIGKNLFEIILSNNGYDVINLGIKVPPENLIEAYHKHKPDAIGLSGLLVKSALMMVDTVEDFMSAGLKVPILAGGAALSEKFTATKIAASYGGIVAYSKDAMSGLAIVNRIISNSANFEKENIERQELLRKPQNSLQKEVKYANSQRSKPIAYNKLLKPKDFEEHVFYEYGLAEIFDFINKQTLYCTHLGLKGNYTDLIKNKDEKALKLTLQVEEIKNYVIENKVLKPKAIYRFFECNSNGNDIIVYEGSKISESLRFPRQTGKDLLCVADFVAPTDKGRDVIGLFVASCGQGIIEKSKELREKGEYLKSHVIQVLAVELAEAFAEIMYNKMKEELSIKIKNPKKEGNGIMLQYGYPECPDLEEQKKLFKLLKPEKINVHLTESLMMEPEASVSGMIFYHPEARHFTL